MTACAEPNVIHLLHGKGHIWLRSTGYVLACLFRLRNESGDPVCTVLQDPRAETSATKDQRLRTKIYQHRHQLNETAVWLLCIIYVPRGVVEVGKRSRRQPDCGPRRMPKVGYRWFSAGDMCIRHETGSRTRVGTRVRSPRFDSECCRDRRRRKRMSIGHSRHSKPRPVRARAAGGSPDPQRYCSPTRLDPLRRLVDVTEISAAPFSPSER